MFNKNPKDDSDTVSGGFNVFFFLKFSGFQPATYEKSSWSLIIAQSSARRILFKTQSCSSNVR